MKTLKIAIQKSGRLNEKSVELLKNCGLNFENYKSSLISPVSNFPLEILFLRDDDIPEYVQDGIADLGIVGENVIEETEVEVSYLQKLGFGKCSLKIAVPNNNSITALDQLNGKAIATTYPVILGKYLKEKGISSDIRTISGSVEISPGLGLSDAICDLVSTGGTLKSNGLVPFADVMSSEAILIGQKGSENDDLIKELIQRIQSVLRAKETKYVVLNVERKNLDAVIALLPGVKSPSVVPLAEVDWVAVHTVIPERDFWDRISQLKQAGAQGIVVMPIEKIIL
ncbi:MULTISPECIES: ATP phosphoribosyltransferase [unclassified Mucilaginibacter]|uniref:ATP phosphoribosyltransferase n=1 Tax=unclassified Mucilaginibacter TaxID=2617802 RepID=UPI002AC8D105|nr:MULTISPECIES: ATP phosphoribosyltransferase [unclassified Mucilaginibacter]MEB0248731.1 ATP phosphoribosyltransferase [Mucilaginibacter sp. 5B2]MEB0263316.1 ATP phosphoribosyltransferase [Mucilaginibacter sp. 10I4]MEB0280738.1 ATP phosphoribosyltransferase [Mucilaginibacter sp. 10B2]MEB0301455.1 ATP phosphoribosyltransferase [Mucilaginibacter sp. 5C4]WPX22673.1 ATP phosphoribosyltransferase [Mucilaginibacter sp. 5C4]